MTAQTVKHTPATAGDLAGDRTLYVAFRLRRSSIEWEDAFIDANGSTLVRISRLVATENGGVRWVSRYVAWDTVVEVIA